MEASSMPWVMTDDLCCAMQHEHKSDNIESVSCRLKFALLLLSIRHPSPQSDSASALQECKRALRYLCGTRTKPYVLVES